MSAFQRVCTGGFAANCTAARATFAGDSTVGKSALAQCFSSGGVDRAAQYEMTTSTQLYTATVDLSDYQKIELYILETPGQSVFSAGGNGQVGVQDTRLGKPLPGVLIANKVDLEAEDRRKVSSEEGSKAAAEFHLEYFETSATHAQGVEKPFKHMAQAQAARWSRSIQALEEGNI